MDPRVGFPLRLFDAFALVGVCLSFMLTMNVLVSAPSFAQQDQAAALDRKINELEGAGKYAEAIPLAQRLLAIQEQAHGRSHRDVATALNILGLLYDGLRRFAEAEPLFKRALAIYEKVSGPDSPDVSTALSNLALVYDLRANALCVRMAKDSARCDRVGGQGRGLPPRP
jgi:tetratricopeptide (TPR) repeat protein